MQRIKNSSQVFGIDLDSWDAAGYWDNDYRPFSLFAPDGRVVASVCLYSMRMVIAGRELRLGQISSTGVLPDWRRQGLARRSTGEALAWGAENGFDAFMLFSSEEALPLYRSHGFTSTEEHTPVLLLATERPRVANIDAVPSGVRLLDMTQPTDRALLYRLACDRCPISQQVGVLNERLLMFRALLPPRASRAYYIPSLKVAVLFRRRDGTLTIYDVVGRRMPTFEELAPFLITPSDREVVFWFMIDSLGDLAALGSLEHRALIGNNLHLKGGISFSPPFVLPFSSQA